MRHTPLLILAYNRPDRVRGLVDSLRPLAPANMMVVVDGPKPGNDADRQKVEAVQATVAEIDWPCTVETRFRPVNLGLRGSVVDAVNWATSEHGEVIVVEEDVLPGPDFLAYATHMLDNYRTDERVGHISGYNVVPPERLGIGSQQSRLTIYPESIAWATWGRAWNHYDDSLAWAQECSIDDLIGITGSRSAAVRWKLNFRDAQANRISTWAYRWIASLWSTGALALSPNHNLVTYTGQDEGTNSILKPRWMELPIYSGAREPLLEPAAEHDVEADEWTGRTVFGETPFGVAKGAAISAVLQARKVHRQARARMAS